MSRSDAVASAVRRRAGSQIARSRAPRAPRAPVSGARVERASVRFSSRCGGGRSMRPHHGA
eukprot:4051101-Lingulodinium_polyedra.AAC.1